MQCRLLPCDCDHSEVDPVCCPHCVSRRARCQHQQLDIVYRHGDKWIHQCQQCQCLVSPVVVTTTFTCNATRQPKCYQLIFAFMFANFAKLSCALQDGEVDCWSLRCPRLACTEVVVRDGDCCPRCATDGAEDPCLADARTTVLVHTAAGCYFGGRVFRWGETWTPAEDLCSTCDCRVSGECADGEF